MPWISWNFLLARLIYFVFSDQGPCGTMYLAQFQIGETARGKNTQAVPGSRARRGVVLKSQRYNVSHGPSSCQTRRVGARDAPGRDSAEGDGSLQKYNWVQGKVTAVPKRYVGGQQPVGDQSGLRQKLWTGYSLRF